MTYNFVLCFGGEIKIKSKKMKIGKIIMTITLIIGIIEQTI